MHLYNAFWSSNVSTGHHLNLNLSTILAALFKVSASSSDFFSIFL